jgi:hypothetical protein
MSQPSNKSIAVDHLQLRRARNQARQSGRPVIVELESLNTGTPDELVHQLAILFGMTAIDVDGLTNVAPAFDLLPLSLARRWRCALMRQGDGALIGVLADPFDPDLQLWLNNQARGPILMCIASSADLQNYFGRICSTDRRGESASKSYTLPPATESIIASQYTCAQSPASYGVSSEVLDVTRDALRRAMRR